MHTAVVDITSAADVDAAAAATTASLGGIEILVAHAGIAGRNETVWDYPVDEWRQGSTST